MPLGARVDRELGLIRFEATGELTVEEVISTIHAMLENPDFQKGLPQLVDLREATGASMRDTDMRRVADRFAREFERIGTRTLALVATQPLLYGLARMWEALAGDIPMQVSVFRDEAAAVAWLKEGEQSG